MSIERFRDVTIETENGAREFRIDRLTPFDGDWMRRALMSKNQLSQEIWPRVQTYCLSACHFYRIDANGGKIPMRIYKDGKFMCPDLELEYDGDAVNSLIEAVLEFNLGSFFKKLLAKMEAAKQAAEVEASATGQ